MQKRDADRGLATLCVGFGQGRSDRVQSITERDSAIGSMERVGRHNDRTDRMIRPNGDRADSRSPPLLFINSQRSRSLCFKYLVRYTAEPVCGVASRRY